MILIYIYIYITANLTLTSSNSIMYIQQILVVIKSSLRPKNETTESFIGTGAISLDTCKYHCQFHSVMSTYLTIQL